MANTDISVILCTHNPRRDYIERTLTSLSRQTLPAEHWNLVVIDNGSSEALDRWLSIPLCINGRIIRENGLGLTRARLRGILETNGSLLVFVDDDNVLDDDYLENAQAIAKNRPYMGAFGGNITGEFEIPPPSHALGLLNWLAILHTDKDVWGNCGLNPLPVGAGLCMPRQVAMQYHAEASAESGRMQLDRKGEALTSGGDNDMILTAMEMGFGAGVFVKLHLRHLIPAQRLSKSYFIRMAEAMAYSQALRGRLGRGPTPVARNWRRELLDALKWPLMSSFERQLSAAAHRGTVKARLEPLP